MRKKFLSLFLVFTMLLSFGCSKSARVNDVIHALDKQKIGKETTVVKIEGEELQEKANFNITKLQNGNDADIIVSTKVSYGEENIGADFKLGFDIKKRGSDIKVGLDSLMKTLAEMNLGDSEDMEGFDPNRSYYFSLSKLIKNADEEKEDILENYNKNKGEFLNLIGSYEPLYLKKSGNAFTYKANKNEMKKEIENFLSFAYKNKESFADILIKISGEEADEEDKKEFYEEIKELKDSQEIEEKLKDFELIEASISKDETNISILTNKKMSPYEEDEKDNKTEKIKFTLNSKWNDRLSVDLRDFKGEEMSDEEVSGLMMAFAFGLIGGLSKFVN